MKKALTAILGAAILGGSIVAATDSKTELEATQTIQKLQHGKYRQYRKGEFREGMEVHVYETDKGPGYQVYESETRENGDVYIRSYGTGPENAFRSYDWKLFSKASSTP